MKTCGSITAIQTQKAHPDRVSLFVDDEFVCGIRRELVYFFHLRVGQTVMEEDQLAWKNEEAKLNARDLAIKYISKRAYSRQQVLNYLYRKDVDPELAEDAISYLESHGYLNDQQFAADFVQNRMQTKPRGKKMIRWELQQKGIAKETIDQALLAYEDEIEAAKRLIAKKSVFKKGEDPLQNRELERKMARFLVGKGFSTSTIQRVLDEFRKETNYF